MKRLFLPLVAIFTLVTASCSGVPSGVIPPKKMARLMADVHIGEAVAESNSSTFRNDSMKQLLKQSIYQRNGVTVEEVDSSFSWYGRHIDSYSKVYDMTVEILEAESRRLAQEAASNVELREPIPFQAEGDSVDVWPLFRSRAFTPRMASDRISFELTSDRYWERGDIYVLRFKTLNGRHPFMVALSGEYRDGNYSYIGSQPSADGWHSLRLSLDPELESSRLSGFIAYPADSLLDSHCAAVAMIDSISLIRLRKGGKSSYPSEGIQREIRPKNKS